jgi:hypothetical protein
VVVEIHHGHTDVASTEVSYVTVSSLSDSTYRISRCSRDDKAEVLMLSITSHRHPLLYPDVLSAPGTCVVVFVVHVCAYLYQKSFFVPWNSKNLQSTRAEETAKSAYNIDIGDKNYIAHLWLTIFYGFLDSMWQTHRY